MNKLKSQLRTASNWTKVHWIWLLSGSVTLLLAFAIFLYISTKWQWADWTGFGQDSNISQEETLQKGKLTVTKRITHYQSGKTLWDWLGLAGVIAIPVVLFQFQQQQQKRSEEQAKVEKARSEAQAKVEKARSEAQAKVEKEIANTNLREEALQNYIDKIAELLIDKELKVLLKEFLKGAIKKDDPRLDALLDVTRARTLSILRRLEGDGDRKGSVVQFLIDAELIEGLDLLMKANLSGANLCKTILKGANLTGTNLSGAVLSFADLTDAALEGADLTDTDLTFADLKGAVLTLAVLNGADLNCANLNCAVLNCTDLTDAALNCADLYNADLNGANLLQANLKSAINLTPTQIKAAENWEQADYDTNFRNKLG